MVDVLMATYNGEKYIREQLDSILNQTYKDFRILIRDDGSNQDNTLGIINEYIINNPNKVFLVKDEVVCKSASKNFMQLLKSATSEYVMFSDQDDYWVENKIERMVNEIKKSERIKNGPKLVFSSYYSANSDLSVKKKSRIKIKKNSLKPATLLVDNFVNGCCMIINKDLYSNLTHEYFDTIMMHDWWITIYASVFGEIKFLDEPLMMYRQHGNQSVGENRMSNTNYIKSRSNKSKYSHIIKKYVDQANTFYNLFGNNMDDKNKELFSAFINIYKNKKLMRIYILRKYKILKQRLISRLGQYYYV